MSRKMTSDLKSSLINLIAFIAAEIAFFFSFVYFLCVGISILKIVLSNAR